MSTIYWILITGQVLLISSFCHGRAQMNFSDNQPTDEQNTTDYDLDMIMLNTRYKNITGSMIRGRIDAVFQTPANKTNTLLVVRNKDGQLTWKDDSGNNSPRNVSSSVSQRIPSRSSVRSTMQHEASLIVFPDNRDEPRLPFQPNKQYVPKCSNEESYCEDRSNYPSELINELALKQFQNLFGKDEVYDVNVAQRFDAPFEESLCASQERTIFPTQALNTNNEYQFIVNVGNYSQGVRIEECVNRNSKCSYSDNFPIGYTTECRQKYTYRTLVALGESGQPSVNLFKVPSCCKCIVKLSHSKRKK